MDGARIAAVTGATGAIGYAIAENIARHAEWELVLIVRDAVRGEEAAKRLRGDTGNSRVSVRTADLGLAADISALAQNWEGPLHALVNNAALTPRRRTETAEGVESQWGVNVLGYYRMARAFGDILADSAPSRLVNVASYWAGDLRLDDPEFRRRRYHNGTAYRQSKQADRMVTVHLADVWSRRGIAVNACHPGDVNSRLSNDLGFGGSTSPSDGADTPAWLAVDPEAEGIHGKWVSSRNPSSDPFGRDTSGLEKLMALLDDYR